MSERKIILGGGIILKKLFFVLTTMIFMLIIYTPNAAFAADSTFVELPAKTNVPIEKDWTIRFNKVLNPVTVNTNTVQVTDTITKRTMPIIVKVGYDLQSLIVSIPAGGYIPARTYALTISSEVQAKYGFGLDKPIKMNFTVKSQFSDTTSYTDLPSIASCKLESGLVISGQAQSILLTAKNGTKVQYRVFTYKYNPNSYVYGDGTYEELTSGYTEAVDAATPYKVSFTKTLLDQEKSTGAKYKLFVYVRRANTTGMHQDTNSDFDNFYTDYFRCISSADTSNVVNGSVTSKTFQQMVQLQSSSSSAPQTDEGGGGWKNASSNQVKYYLNPDNFKDSYGKYMFLKLDYTNGINAEDLDNILRDKGAFEDQINKETNGSQTAGQIFLDAAQKNNISPIYFISHSLLETNNGKSELASGVLVKTVDGKPVEKPQIVYNIAGIKAYDSDPVKYGSEYAYKQGWVTLKDSIYGAAQYVSSQYINNTQGKQNTLYKMRWNPDNPGIHQYATDVSWAYSQIKNIKYLIDECENPSLVFEVPDFPTQ